jgi:hypothetical protein
MLPCELIRSSAVMLSTEVKVPKKGGNEVHCSDVIIWVTGLQRENGFTCELMSATGEMFSMG